MTIRAAIRHVTRYRYDRRVGLGPQVIRLRPAPHCRTPILAYSLKVSPAEHFLNWQQDPQSNWLARVVVPEKTDHFEVAVDRWPNSRSSTRSTSSWSRTPSSFLHLFAGAGRRPAPYLRRAECGDRFRAYLDSVPREPKPTTAFLFDLNSKVAGDIDYLIRMEPGIQTPDETLERAAGSCRDSGWLLVQLLRHLGWPPASRPAT